MWRNIETKILQFIFTDDCNFFGLSYQSFFGAKNDSENWMWQLAFFSLIYRGLLTQQINKKKFCKKVIILPIIFTFPFDILVQAKRQLISTLKQLWNKKYLIRRFAFNFSQLIGHSYISNIKCPQYEGFSGYFTFFCIFNWITYRRNKLLWW